MMMMNMMLVMMMMRAEEVYCLYSSQFKARQNKNVSSWRLKQLGLVSYDNSTVFRRQNVPCLWTCVTDRAFFYTTC